MAFQSPAGTGTVNYDFELNQAPYNRGTGTLPAFPTRTAGDLLITYDGDMSDPAGLNIGVCRWQPNAAPSVDGRWVNFDGTFVDGNQKGCKSLSVPVSTPAGTRYDFLGLASINIARIFQSDGLADFSYEAADPSSTDPNLSTPQIQPGGFGEAALDLTRILNAYDANSCTSFGSFWMHSRTGNSMAASLQDATQPTELVTGSCGLKVEKFQRVRATPDNAYQDTQLTGVQPGQVIEYQLKVTNTGNKPINTVVVNDALCSPGPLTTHTGDDNGNGKLDVTETWYYTCSYAVPSQPTSLTITNTVTADGTGPDNSSVTQSTDSVTATVSVNTSLTLDKTESVDSGATWAGAGNPSADTSGVHIKAGQTINYKVLVTAGGNVAQTVTFTDATCDTGTIQYRLGTAAAAPYTAPIPGVAPGTTITFTCTHLVAQTDAPTLTNVASATGSNPLVTPNTSATDTVTANVHYAGIAVDKLVGASASGPWLGANDQPNAAQPTGIAFTSPSTVYYRFVVTVTGNTAQTVTFTDNQCDASSVTYSLNGGSAVSYTATTKPIATSNDTLVFTCSHAIASGSTITSLTNNVTVTGTSTYTGSTTSTDTVTVPVHHPLVTIAKMQTSVANPSTGDFTIAPLLVHPGDVITYQLTVTNAGDVPVSLSVVDTLTHNTVDSRTCTVTNNSTVLGIGQSATYTCTYTVDITDRGTLRNTGSVTGTDSDGHASVAGSNEVVATVTAPSVVVDKEVSATGAAGIWTGAGKNASSDLVFLAGQTIYYRITATITDLPGATADLQDGVCDSAITVSWVDTAGLSHTATFANGQTVVLNGSGADTVAVFECSRTPAADTTLDSLTNTATVLAKESVDTTWLSDADSVTNAIHRPHLTVDKYQTNVAAPTDNDFTKGAIDVKVNDVITYRIVVTNDGNVPVTVALSDVLRSGSPLATSTCTGLTQDPTPLAVGEANARTYTCTHTVTETDADTIYNKATATGTDSDNHAAPDAPSNEIEARVHTAHILLDKQVSTTGNADSYVAVGNGVQASGISLTTPSTVYYRFVVTVSGNTPLTVTFDDPKCDAGTVSYTLGDADAVDYDADHKPVAAAGDALVFTCTHDIARGETLDQMDNLAHVDGANDLVDTVSSEDAVSVPVHRPHLTVDKYQTNVAAPTDNDFTKGAIDVKVNDVITYRIVVTNDGNVPVTVTLSDVLRSGTPLATSTCTGLTQDPTPLAVGEANARTYTCTHTVTETDADTIYNKATATGTDSDNHAAPDASSNEVEAHVHTAGIAVDKQVGASATGPWTAIGAGAEPGNLSFAAGSTVYYRFPVTITGNSVLTVTFADAKCDAGTLTYSINGGDATAVTSATVIQASAADHLVFACSHRIAADATISLLTNTASVTGTNSHTDDVTGDDTVTVPVYWSALTVDKTQTRNASTVVNGAGAFGPTNNTPMDVEVNDVIHYAIAVTVSGNTSQTVYITDATCDSAITYELGAAAAQSYVAATGVTGVAPGTTVTFRCTHTVVAGDAAAGTNLLTNVASVRMTSSLSGTKTGSDQVTALVHVLGLSTVKEQATAADGPWFTDESDPTMAPVYKDDVIYYRFTVTNTGNTTLTVTPHDPACDAGTISPTSATLTAGANTTFTCSHTATETDARTNGGIFANTAWATGTDAFDGSTESNHSTVHERVLITLVSVDKVIIDPVTKLPVNESYAHVGDIIKYTITVTNTGNNTIDFSLLDAECDSGWYEQSVVPDVPDNAREYSCTHTVLDSDPVTYVNTAVLTGTDEGGQPVSANDSVTTHILKPAVTLDKQVRLQGAGAFGETVAAHVGDTLEFRLVARNTGNAPLTIDVVDPACGALTADTAGFDGVNDTLALGQTVTFTCTHVVSALDATPYVNVARISGDDGHGGTVVDTDDATGTIVIPGVALQKLVRNASTGGAFAATATAVVGQTLEFQITVTNTGNTNATVTVSDSKCSPLVAAPGFTGTLAPGASTAYTCSHATTAADTGSYVNVATVTARDTIGGTATASNTASATVTAPAPSPAPAAAAVVAKPTATSALVQAGGCMRGGFAPYVRGTNILKVQYYVDGRLRATVTRATKGKWIGKLTTTGLSAGTHRLTVRVTFTKATGAKVRTYKASFGVCKPKAVLPAFTG